MAGEWRGRVGCPALFCSVTALLSSAVTGEPAAGSTALALGDPTFTGKSLRDRGSDHSPCFYGGGEMRYGARHRWELAADTGVGWSQEVCKVPGSPPGAPRARTPGMGSGQHLGRAKSRGCDPAGQHCWDPLLQLWGFAGVCTDPLTMTVSSLAHQVHLPQHLPCGPDHCPSPLNEEQPQPLPRGPGCGFVPGLEHWL